MALNAKLLFMIKSNKNENLCLKLRKNINIQNYLLRMQLNYSDCTKLFKSS